MVLSVKLVIDFKKSFHTRQYQSHSGPTPLGHVVIFESITLRASVGSQSFRKSVSDSDHCDFKGINSSCYSYIKRKSWQFRILDAIQHVISGRAVMGS